MASLSVRTPDGKVRTFPLIKRITSIGRGPDNDVQLDDPGIPDSALHVLFDGSRFQVGSLGATFQINGKKRDSHVLASQDVIRVGGTELTFARDDAPAPRSTPPPTVTSEPPASDESHTAEIPGIPGRELVMLRRLTTFSERLLGSYDLEKLLENQTVLDLVRKRLETKQLTAAICAGPKVLVKAGLPSGTKVTSTPDARADMGDVAYVDDAVVIDGPIITSRGPGTAVAFALALVEALCGADKAAEIRKKTVSA